MIFCLVQQALALIGSVIRGSAVMESVSHHQMYVMVAMTVVMAVMKNPAIEVNYHNWKFFVSEIFCIKKFQVRNFQMLSIYRTVLYYKYSVSKIFRVNIFQIRIYSHPKKIVMLKIFQFTVHQVQCIKNTYTICEIYCRA